VKASELLGISDRQFRRLWKRFQADGLSGLISQKRGKPSNHQIPAEIKREVLKQLKSRYRGFGPTLATEKLFEEHGIKLSEETLRLWMIEEGLWQAKARKRPKLHQSRNRRERLGELIQMDGSPHDWFEGRREKCCLLGFIDDATSRIMHLHFTECETTEAYFRSINTYCKKHGKPESFYSDRLSVFRINNHKPGYRGLSMPQVGRGLKELGINLICANSPQAKGRIERLFGVLQDRLVKEMSLKNISSIEEANAYLPGFIESYNTKFSVPPKKTEDAHRAIPISCSLDRILCYKETRKLTKNLELSYHNKILQIKTDYPTYALRGAHVEVVETLDGQIIITHNNTELKFNELLVKDSQGTILNRKEVCERRKTTAGCC